MGYSNSFLQQYKDCPLSCYLKYEVGLEKIDEEKSEHHLVFGRACHEGLKRLYLGDTLEASKEALKKIYVKQLDLKDKAKTQANGLLMLDAYAKRWAEEDKKWRVVQVEEKERFGYADQEQFTVVLDLVMENIQFGGIYGFDHKIVGGKKATLSFDFWNQFEPNAQITKYVAHIKNKFGDCSGFYINAVGMRWLERKYKDSPAGLNLRFERQMYNRNEQQLQKEEKDTTWWIGRVEESRKTGAWGMNTSMCKFCQYRPVCSAGWTWPEDQELITIQYKVSPRATEKERVNVNE